MMRGNFVETACGEGLNKLWYVHSCLWRVDTHSLNEPSSGFQAAIVPQQIHVLNSAEQNYGVERHPPRVRQSAVDRAKVVLWYISRSSAPAPTSNVGQMLEPETGGRQPPRQHIWLDHRDPQRHRDSKRTLFHRTLNSEPL